ncbi:MAG: extracellular solute-binding protein [Lachnospiraceae bacterium]|nr:extracellular solute-binding protein [Lachnospiraceae bacterium]
MQSLKGECVKEKQRKYKSWLTAVLAVVFAAVMFLSSCGSESGSAIEKVQLFDEGEESSANAGSWAASHVSLDWRLEEAIVKDGTVYGCYMEENGLHVVVCSMEGTGSGSETLIAGAESVLSLTVDSEGNVYILGEKDSATMIWRVGSDGDVTEVGEFTLDDAGEAKTITPKALFLDSAGNFYFWAQMTIPTGERYGNGGIIHEMVNRVYVKDAEMNSLYYLSTKSILGVCFDEEGVPTVLARDSEGTIYLQEVTAQSVEQETRTVLTNAGDMASADNIAISDEGFLYSSGSALYQFDPEDETTEKIFELSSFGISSSDILFMEMHEGVIELIDNYGEDSSEYMRLKQGESSKTVITLGGVMLSDDADVQELVTQFNRYHDDIQVEIVDYYDDSDEEDGVAAGVEQLNLDIVRNNAPDIILGDGSIDFDIYAGLGFFTDLYELMKMDADCPRDTFVTQVLELYETNGHLYSIAPAFSIYSMWGSNETTQGKCGVSFEEMIQLLSDAGQDINAIYGFSADEPVLTTLCTVGMDEFIDWDSLTCDFESEAFCAVLQFAAQYTGGYKGYLSTGIASGEVLLEVGVISDVSSYQIASELFGGSLNFIGYPTAEGTGTALYYRGGQLGINAESDNVQAAWEFVKYYILHRYDVAGGEYQGFPLVMAQLEDYFAAAMVDDTTNGDGTGERIAKATYYDENGYIIVYAASENDIEAVRDLIEKADRRFEYHTEILDIINEEAAYYFSGQKSMEDVTALIQNRVNLYLQELK